MADTAPLSKVVEANVGGQATAGSVYDQTVGEAPFAGTVTAVTYTPEAAITGAATNFRTFRVVNKGQAGSGTTVVASLAFSSGAVTAAAFDEKSITLSGTPGNLVVAEGDMLVWDETVAGTGLASPGGLVRITIERS
jgi:hypothetical protein